ncbi:MAG: hypothetical protein HOL15_02940 [Nitrospinaceae bacterium]|nr:hypothetical protein [Nitrospina sp.]MBT5375750.1 hypothetical protein [Nitrospinaceae bacterium]MBT5868032.1 hypothetical protein [Nitrospinaceae bacterium]
MTFRFTKKFMELWKLALLGVIIPFFLLPFIHYHPETNHSHSEQTEAHSHNGRYHSATIEAYAHLVNGHFSNVDMDDHFHHSHSSEESDEGDTDLFILAKTTKPLKQGLTLELIGLPSRLEYSNPLFTIPIGFKTAFDPVRSSANPHSSRSPPLYF